MGYGLILWVRTLSPLIIPLVAHALCSVVHAILRFVAPMTAGDTLCGGSAPPKPLLERAAKLRGGIRRCNRGTSWKSPGPLQTFSVQAW